MFAVQIGKMSVFSSAKFYPCTQIQILDKLHIA